MRMESSGWYQVSSYFSFHLIFLDSLSLYLELTNLANLADLYISVTECMAFCM